MKKGEPELNFWDNLKSGQLKPINKSASRVSGIKDGLAKKKKRRKKSKKRFKPNSHLVEQYRHRNEIIDAIGKDGSDLSKVNKIIQNHPFGISFKQIEEETEFGSKQLRKLLLKLKKYNKITSTFDGTYFPIIRLLKKN